MSLLSITSETPDDLFKPFEFPVLPAGKHLFVVANELEIAEASDPESTNKVIKLEARCQDEDESKGMVVFDNFVIVTNPTTDKAVKSKRMQDAKLAQFVAACGVATPDEIKCGKQFDLTDFKDKAFTAETKIAMEAVFPPEFDAATNKPKKAMRASIKHYLYEQK